MSSTTNEIVVLIHDLARCIHHNTGKVKRELEELTLLQIRALKHIQALGKVTMGSLAEELQISAASATALVDRLIKAEWIVRLSHEEDRRIVYLTLSDEKRTEWSQVMRNKTHYMETVIEHLSTGDQRELHRLLSLIMSTVKQPNEQL